MPDIVRVLRVVEYVGPRDLVEDQIAKSIHGSRQCGPGGAIRISAATIGEFPEILNPERGPRGHTCEDYEQKEKPC